MMRVFTKRALFWAPRILCILFAVFVSMFALDVFGEGYGFWETVGAFLIHLVPTYIVVIALVVAWHREWIGSILFIGLAVFYLVWSRGRFPWVTYLAMAGPLFLVGVLFLVNWLYRVGPRSAKDAT